ncbi:MAG: hypothetical protein NTY77_19325 [Elusimicrobia bacterium]|nr:hypothetical protein [Elusimicrobiota bacterium]
MLISALCLTALLPISAQSGSGGKPDGQGELQTWKPASDPSQFLAEVEPHLALGLKGNYYHDGPLEPKWSAKMLDNAQAIMTVADPIPVRVSLPKGHVRYDDGHTLVAVAHGKAFVVCVQGKEGGPARRPDGSIGKDTTPVMTAADQEGRPGFFGMSQSQLDLIRLSPDDMSAPHGVVFGTKITVANLAGKREIDRFTIGFQFPGKEPWDKLVELTKDAEGKMRAHSQEGNLPAIKAALLFWVSLTPEQLSKAGLCTARR